MLLEIPGFRLLCRTSALAALSFLSMTGCLRVGTGDGSGTGSTGGNATGGSDSTDPCDAWKVSYCKAISKCASFELRQECQDDVGYVICSEGAPVAECTKSIDAALSKSACDELPTDCGPKFIADRTEPTNACRDIYQAICEWSLYCSASESIDSCVAKLEVDNPCTDYTAAIYPNLEACLDAYRVLSCGDSPPAACDHILRK